jgi:hypothetical protein
MMTKPEIDYSYYELVRVDVERNEFAFVTAAIMQCLLCGTAISGMGGPGEAICIKCGDVVKRRQAIGAIKWD